GLQYREQLIKDRLMDTDEFMQRLDRDEPYRAPGTAVYMTTNTEDIPRSLYYNFEQNNAVHEQVILLTFKQADSPYVENEDRYEQEDLENNIHRIIAHYGFMEKPDVPETMALVDKHDNGIDIDLDEISYVLGGETLVPASEIGMAKWKATIFAWLNRNATPATQYFNVPPEHTIEIGTRLKI
ncbi:MAG: potassium transporter Kup, partial [bacterium]